MRQFVLVTTSKLSLGQEEMGIKSITWGGMTVVCVVGFYWLLRTVAIMSEANAPGW